MRLPERSSGSTSPRFSRHSRNRAASSLPIMIRASEPPKKCGGRQEKRPLDYLTLRPPELSVTFLTRGIRASNRDVGTLYTYVGTLRTMST